MVHKIFSISFGGFPLTNPWLGASKCEAYYTVFSLSGVIVYSCTMEALILCSCQICPRRTKHLCGRLGHMEARFHLILMLLQDIPKSPKSIISVWHSLEISHVLTFSPHHTCLSLVKSEIPTPLLVHFNIVTISVYITRKSLVFEQNTVFVLHAFK